MPSNIVISGDPTFDIVNTNGVFHDDPAQNPGSSVVNVGELQTALNTFPTVRILSTSGESETGTISIQSGFSGSRLELVGSGPVVQTLAGNLTLASLRLETTGAVVLGSPLNQIASLDTSSVGSLDLAVGGSLTVAGPLISTGATSIQSGGFLTIASTIVSGGAVDLRSGGGINVLGAIDSGSSATTLTSAMGGITVSADIGSTAGNTTLTAGSGISGSGTIHGQTVQLTGHAGGIVARVDANTLHLASGANASVTDIDDIRLGSITVDSGRFDLTAGGGVALGSIASNGGAVTATDGSGAGNDITADQGGAITWNAGSGDVELRAGDDLRLDGAFSIRTSGHVRLFVDAGNADAGVGGTADIDASISAASIAITGNDDADTLRHDIVTSAVVTIDGRGGDDTITGGASADILTGGAGNDTLDGRGGTDVAKFTGALADYRIEYVDAATLRVTDLRSGSPDGADMVANVETFEFSDTSRTFSDFVNDAPVNAVPGAQTIAEDTDLALTTLSVADPDAGSGVLTTTLSVTHGTLTAASVPGGATFSGNGSGAVTLSGTLTEINATLSAAAGVVYRGDADYHGSDTLTVATRDGGSSGLGGERFDTDAVAITVTPVNDAPVTATNAAGNVSYTESGSPLAIVPALTLSDIDSPSLTGGTLTLSGFVPGDQLLFTNQNGIDGTYDTGTGVLTLSGTASVAAYQTALQSVMFRSTSNDPTDTDRTLSITVTDGQAESAAVTRVIDVTPVNDPPVAAIGSGTPVNYIENDPGLVVASGLTLTDVDGSTLASAAVSISGNFVATQDVLAFVNDPAMMGNIVASYDGTTGVLSLSSAGATATLAQWQAALRSVTYSNTSDAPSGASRTLSITVDDGAASSSPVTREIVVVPINDAPTGQVAIDGAAVENGILSADTGGLGDADGLGTFSYRWQRSEDGTNWSDIGGATQETYQLGQADVGQTMRVVVSYVDEGGTLETTFSASTAAIGNVNDAPLVLTNASDSLSYTENGSPVAIVPALTLSDVDSPNLTGATLALSGMVAGDGFGFVEQNGITGSFDAGTGALSLTGTATVAQYQAALRSVTFESTSEDPTDGARSVSITVNDGSDESVSVARSITVVPSNDAPVITSNGGGAPATLTYAENDTAIVTTVTASDVDNDAADLRFSIAGGADRALFAIDSVSGVLTFLSSPDFENPRDAGRDNIYDVTVAVEDGEALVEQSLAISVTNVAESVPTPPRPPATIVANADGSTTIRLAQSLTPAELARFATPGVDTVSSPFSVVLPDGIENVTLTGTANIDATGNNGANALTGNDGSNILTGDAPPASAGLVSAAFTLTGDSAIAPGGADTIAGGLGNDVLFGNQGADILFGNQGNDTLYGGKDDDAIYGGKDDDHVEGNLGDDIVEGNLGNDLVLGNQGDDTVNGNQGNDTVHGGQGNDLVHGGQGDDLVFGDKGNDQVWGGLGNDTLTGGEGTDTFFFALNSGNDIIVDFNQSEGDRLDFQGQTYTVQDVDGSAVFTLSGGGVVVLTGVTAASLDAGAFV